VIPIHLVEAQSTSLEPGLRPAATSHTVTKRIAADLTTQERTRARTSSVAGMYVSQIFPIDLHGHRVHSARAPGRYSIRTSADATPRTLAAGGRWHHLCTVSGRSLRPSEAQFIIWEDCNGRINHSA
jgi:hypothetical protein